MNRLLSAALWLAITATAAFANGAIAERKTGGLVFKQSDTVSILREDLSVSLHKITVDYLYKSAAAAAQTVTIAFPMPGIPVNDDPGSLRETLPEGSPPENYMGFKVWVDGKEVKAEPFARALVNDRDVTEKITQAGLPLHMLVDDANALLKKVPKPELDELVALGAVGQGESYGEPAYWPQWDCQVAFEWQQDFRPGETKVSISYVPLAGYPADIGDSYEKGEWAEAACVDAAVRAALAKRKAKGTAYYEVATVGYVLTTAKYWKGPIRRFNLSVEKPDAAALAAFCPPEAKKVSPTRFEWQAKDFTPKADLSVVFYTFQEPE
ncbi:DUF4424 family protein [Taklimakanibacter deserti]|uniref:DUF4424 family protein n=1 Tax=Taklimakanibacter deserti TaxID=2267839 RepID=UPI000E64D1F7